MSDLNRPAQLFRALKQGPQSWQRELAKGSLSEHRQLLFFIQQVHLLFCFLQHMCGSLPAASQTCLGMPAAAPLSVLVVLPANMEYVCRLS